MSEKRFVQVRKSSSKTSFFISVEPRRSIGIVLTRSKVAQLLKELQEATAGLPEYEAPLEPG